MSTFKIGKRIIGDNNPAFIIAELSANHKQKFDLAVQSIKAIKDSGADAVKFQTYTPDTITFNSDKKYFQVNQGTIWDGTTLYKLYKKAYTPWEWQPKLKKIAEDLGLICFSSPFDKSAVDFLEEMKVPAYKIASFEITDIPLIEYVASKGKPVILSTGIAQLKDIHNALNACKKAGNSQIALLKCTSEYPTPYEDVNLLTIPDMKKRFNKIIGLSDHTVGLAMPIASVALGAKIIEKHFILEDKLGSPDSSFSLPSKKFKTMIQAIRDTEKALGKATYKLTLKQKKSREHSRSLFSVKKILKGETFTENNIKSIRPFFGLEPKHLEKVLGKKARKNIEAGEPLKWSLISKN
jgi:pseudaminic acid synthase